MKWACKNTFSVYSYEIDIDKMISPVYHLILDLLRDKKQDRPFDEWIGEVFNMSILAGHNQITTYDTEESFLVTVSDYLEDWLYEKVCLLENSGILLMYRAKRIFIAPSKPDLINWIKRSKVMDRFLDLVNNPGISNVKETLSKFMNEQYFKSYVQIKESELKGTFIPKKFIKERNYTEVPIDEESIWLSSECKVRLAVQETTQYSEVSFPDIDGSFIAVGNLLLTTEYVGRLVKPEYSTEYFWTMLNDVYAHKNHRYSRYKDNCSKFTNALRKPEFANLMSKLQYNLYLFKADMERHEEFKEFFEEVYNIEQFKEETNHILFTGSHVAEQVENKQTMFGLYKTVKDDTEFNLRAWINVETVSSQKMTTSSGENKVEIKTVYALKPHYSYYFCKDYFEDMFADMLKESGIQSLSNFELYKSDAPNNCFIEIDQMVKKADGLIYIETKTTLNRYNIEETVKEVSRFHQIMATCYPGVRMKYLLVSLYYNKTVEEGFSYFTNADGSSIKDFKIPIVQYPGIDLHCIVEPEYGKLKSRMEQLLK